MSRAVGQRRVAGSLDAGATALGALSVAGALNVTGAITGASTCKATQFRASSDGTSAQFAYTWDADPNIGLRRVGSDQFVVGVAGNQVIIVSQFQASFGEGLQNQGGLSQTSSLSPTAITGTQNDYTPTSWNGARFGVRQDLTGNAILTGLAATSTGHLALLTNINTGAFTLTLNHQDAGSIAANRFFCPNKVSFVLAPGEAVWLQYDGTSACWRVLGTA